MSATQNNTKNGTTSNTTTNKLVLYFVMGSIGFTLVTIFGPTLYLVEQHDSHTVDLIKQQQQQQQQHQVAQKVAVSSAASGNGDAGDAGDAQMDEEQQQEEQEEIMIEDLPDEYQFRATIKDCLPEGFVDDADKEEKKQQQPKKKKCLEYMPESRQSVDEINSGKTKKKIQRIAIISPPGELMGPVLDLAEIIGYEERMRGSSSASENGGGEQQQKTADQPQDDGIEERDADSDIDVVETTHVPPYGYGKTHGLTKIIRLVPEPILLQVTDTLLSVLQEEESYEIITIDDLAATLRLIMRFHCRLSHVAAHTSLLSISLFDFMTEKGKTFQRVHRFLAPNQTTPHHHQQHRKISLDDDDDDEKKKRKNAKEKKEKKRDDDATDDVQADDDDDTDENLIDDDIVAEFETDDQGELYEMLEMRGSRVLLHVQEQLIALHHGGNNNRQRPPHVAQVLNQVLLDEMRLSKNMTVWPCPSFWTVGGSGIKINYADPSTALKLSPLVQRLAAQLSPDCDHDPYVKCFVARDKCEAKGDGVCSGDGAGNKKQNNMVMKKP